MIIDAQQLAQDAEVRGRVAIIGAGAAGITLTLELAKNFKEVILLESGGLEFEQETQDLYKGRDLGHSGTIPAPGRHAGPETPLDASRLRYFGGTTNHWTGLCAPIDAEDFEPIADQIYTGWPFQLGELVPFYERAYPYCEIGTFQKPSRMVSESESNARKILDSLEFKLAEYRRSPPTRFGERYRSELMSSDRVRVYLHANVTDLQVPSSGQAISSLDVRTLNGRNLRVTADAFILCCGGIENARILLNCTRYFPTGIGNQHDLVGRFFMNNPLATVGTIVPRNKNFDLGPMYLGQDGLVSITLVFKSSAETATRPGRRGASIFLVPLYDDTSFIGRARYSPASEAVRSMLQDVKHAHIPTNFADNACIALEDPASVAVAAYYGLTKFIRGREPLKAVYARIEGAQRPNPNSRVTLSDDVDALGMKSAALDWRISDEDYDNLYKTSVTFAQGIGVAGFGRMNLEIKPERDLSGIVGTGHHIGTTRMHDNRRQGVVDPNCRVHGLDNFYVAGSSVFPTGPRVNPTLTIVAMAIRLADHLGAKLRAA